MKKSFLPFVLLTITGCSEVNIYQIEPPSVEDAGSMVTSTCDEAGEKLSGCTGNDSSFYNKEKCEDGHLCWAKCWLREDVGCDVALGFTFSETLNECLNQCVQEYGGT